MPIKSFRGKLKTGATNIQTISLSTNNGSTGYRIKKFELLGSNGNEVYESVVEVHTINKASSGIIDFEDNTLLAAGIYQDSSTNGILGDSQIVFDNITFNQDIYISYIETGSSTSGINYHIELEQVKLDLNENTVATLKDIRNIKGQ
jgi:hypothetical protein